MPFTGSFNIQGSFGEISAANFDSGNAPDTHALFADGEGGAEWRAPAGGSPAGGSTVNPPHLGNLSQLSPGNAPTGNEITLQFISVTGGEPVPGTLATMLDASLSKTVLLICENGDTWYGFASTYNYLTE